MFKDQINPYEGIDLESEKIDKDRMFALASLTKTSTQELWRYTKGRVTDKSGQIVAYVRWRFDRRDLVAISIIFAVATLIMLPMFDRGLPNGDDASTNYRWAVQFTEALREGILYPRWLASANNWQGSPALLYYPPLTLYVVAAFNTLTGDALQALVLACWLGLAVSGVTIFFFSRSLLQPWFSLFVALVYLMMPTHLFDLYQKTAVSEFWSFAWVPLLLDAIHRVAARDDGRGVPLLALSYALLLFTHVPISFVVTLALPFYILFLTRDVRRLFRIGLGLALGLGISAIYLMPIKFERGYVNLDRLLYFNYSNHFLFEDIGVALRTKWLSPDLSIYPGLAKPKQYSFLLHNNQLAVSLLLLFMLSSLAIWITWRSYDHALFSKKAIWATWSITALSLLMTTRLTSPIWRTVVQLPYIQFPARWLVISTVGVSLLTAVALSLSALSKVRITYFSALSAGLIFAFTLSLLTIAQAPYDRATIIEGASYREVPEYRPIWWNKKSLWPDGKPDAAYETLAKVNSGDASIGAIAYTGIRQAYKVHASTESILVFRSLYFPGWTAHLDGNPIAVTPSNEGNIQLMVEPGEHSLTLSFEDTWPRSLGKIISVISFVATLIALYIFRRDGAILEEACLK